MRAKYLVVAGAAAALQAAQPAFAASCSSWSAKMEEDEGGKVLTASVCGGPKGDAHLMLTCFDTPVLSYDLGASGQQLEPGISGSFDFKADGKTVTKTLQLEAMYNYFTVDLARADPLLDLLRSKGAVSVSAAKYGQGSFPLKGSSAAIGKVLAQCGKAKPAGDGD
ncbi:hypothetical protein [Mesorhizobium qingshengii]|uniref:Invasion protein IalB, involved in pathogenesis n=1 Tax=Mesorhizobium qingshengii TaxID=1165689 RepID=A0A1G5Z2Q5_9HYPH|nr:hypothetical protein [Mesorhizobium qingshengii]SDA89138.1 hypothetical protein SAMN02927914_04140 [Mesorhizobium qingshengii]